MHTYKYLYFLIYVYICKKDRCSVHIYVKIETQTAIAYNATQMERILGQIREGDFVAHLASLAQISNEDIQVNQLAAHYGDLALDINDEKELGDHFMEEFQPTNSPDDLNERLLFGEEDDIEEEKQTNNQ